MKPNAFTLVELLVVVTIIVILLALLAPALDRAIYQAELAACGAQLRGITLSSLTYAMEYKREYPNRGTASYTWTAMELKAFGPFNPAVNIPALLQSYVAVKNFVDPFLAAANLDLDDIMRDPNAFFLPGYHYYGDWGGGANLTPMKKVGSRMIFEAPEGDTRSFSVIFADRDVRYTSFVGQVSHPDHDGRLTLWSYHGGGNPWSAGGFGGWASGGFVPGQTVGPVEGNFYVSWWEGTNRGTLDNHYGLDDGSVLRLNDVPMVMNPEDDPRITFVPDEMSLDSYNAGRKQQLPRSN